LIIGIYGLNTSVSSSIFLTKLALCFSKLSITIAPAFVEEIYLPVSRLKSDLILLFVAAIWGSGFVAQGFAANLLHPFYFNGGRFLIGGLLLLPLIKFKLKANRRDLPLMILAGVLLFIASGFQQAGLMTTTIGNASFITGLYVVMVPIILFIFWRRKVFWLTWAAALTAAAGVGLLSLSGEFRLNQGDALELAGAFVWAAHVILVGIIAKRGAHILSFAIIQFFASGLLGFSAGLILDPSGLTAFSITWHAVLYSAIFSVALGFTLQAVGQKGAPPTDAAIILSMEAVFGALFGYLFFHELLTPIQLVGCALILASILMAQIKLGPEPELEPAG
jgi:drug/metabolite transporter (DMT)-like permease